MQWSLCWKGWQLKYVSDSDGGEQWQWTQSLAKTMWRTSNPHLQEAMTDAPTPPMTRLVLESQEPSQGLPLRIVLKM